MIALRRVSLVVAACAVAAVLWVLLLRASDRARWLQVEISDPIVRGRPVTLEITLDPSVTRGFIRADLHWKDTRRVSRGALSIAAPQAIEPGVSRYRFQLLVPPRSDFASYVYGVIYVSPTGGWRERTHACLLDEIRVRPAGDSPSKPGLRRVTPHEQPLVPTPPRQDSRPVRWATACLLALSAFGSGWVGRRRSPAVGAADLAIRWRWLAVACALGALWEASGGEALLGHWLRQIALARGWYEHRRQLQELLTLGVIAVTLVLAALALRRDHAQPVSLVYTSADLFWGISAVSFISLHDADAWLATPLWRIPVAQVVKLAAALVAAAGAAQAVGRAPR
ncbi:MAG: hypothetical protein HZC55_15085 [Verrucomicrobia bacterium]|nr:hypothetical protein [Verrucomicrobiota bacterium]